MLQIAFYLGGAFLSVLIILAIAGALLPKAHVAACRACYSKPPQVIFELISNFERAPEWRPDVVRVERAPDRDGRPVYVEIQKRGRLPIEIVDVVPNKKLVGRIADPKLPFGGTWTHEIEPADGGGCVYTITERGEIYNVFVRALARFAFGYHSTLESYQKALAKHLGETPAVERC